MSEMNNFRVFQTLVDFTANLQFNTHLHKIFLNFTLHSTIVFSYTFSKENVAFCKVINVIIY